MNSVVSISTTALYIKDMFWKLEVLLHNSNIYICAGEHDDNMIFVHEIDWKIKMNNRHMSLMLLATLKIVSWLKNYCYHNHDNIHIVKLLCLPQSFHKHVWVSLDINFTWSLTYWINYKLQVPNWILIKIMKFQSNTVRWK